MVVDALSTARYRGLVRPGFQPQRGAAGIGLTEMVDDRHFADIHTGLFRQHFGFAGRAPGGVIHHVADDLGGHASARTAHAQRLLGEVVEHRLDAVKHFRIGTHDADNALFGVAARRRCDAAIDKGDAHFGGGLTHVGQLIEGDGTADHNHEARVSSGQQTLGTVENRPHLFGIHHQHDHHIRIARHLGATGSDRRHQIAVFPFQCRLRINIVDTQGAPRAGQTHRCAAAHLAKTYYSCFQHTPFFEHKYYLVVMVLLVGSPMAT